MQIEEIEISKIKLYDKNPRKNDEAVQYVANSIQQFGMNDPIGIWGKDNLIVEGHGRLLAVKELGFDKVPCIRLDNLTDEQRRAYAIAHNSTAERSEWDADLLNLEIEELDFDFDDFGLDLEFEEQEEQKIEQQELKPFAKVHYLITVDINENPKILNIIEQLKHIEGVEIESTLN